MAASEASLDEQLELKKRARRRLVGAVALALLAAIVLPMVMDHEPRPANQDIQVRIPNPESVGSFVPRAAPASVAAQPDLAEPTAEAKPDAEARSGAKPESAAKLPSQGEAKLEVAPAVVAAAKPVDKAPEKAAEKLPQAPADKPHQPHQAPADNPAEAARAADALNGGNAEQWVIQLGAYKEGGNVKLLLSKLKGVGLAAYTEKFDSPQGPRTRVRAGPFPNREAAEKARAKVKIIGVDGPVAPK